MPSTPLQVRQFGLTEYQQMYEFMQRWSVARDADSPDELWLLEHAPVYTLGRNARPEHVLNPAGIPLVQVDRGGQVTYHGPGQLVVYLMLDVRRGGWGVRQLVTAMESALVRLLKGLGLEAYADSKAPGVYLEGRKIAALGLRVKGGKSYHGLSLNLDMDLSPFLGINPCGYQGLEVIQLVDQVQYQREQLEHNIVTLLAEELGFKRSVCLPALKLDDVSYG